MEEQFVFYNIALKLKELGFNEKCLAWYNQDDNNRLAIHPQLSSYSINSGRNSHVTSSSYGSTVINSVEAPLWQQVTEWLRKVHDLDTQVEKFIGGGTGIAEVYIGYVYRVHSTEGDFSKETNYVYDTHEDALKATIELALNLI